MISPTLKKAIAVPFARAWRNAPDQAAGRPGAARDRLPSPLQGGLPPRRLLLLSVSAGAGHLRAAEALRAHALALHPGVAVSHVDVMEHVPAAFRKLYTDFYIALVNRRPALWGYLYRLTNEARPDSRLQRLRRAIERLNTRRLLKEIEAFRPEAIVCTHFLPAGLLSHLLGRRRLACPVWVQVTDFDLHRLWVQPHMHGYFAGSDEVAFRMRAAGIAPAAVRVTGIPVMPAFVDAPAREACRREFGLAPQRPTVLLMGGGAGLGSLEQVAAQLLALPRDFQLIVLAGRNAAALAALQQLAHRHPGRLLPQGFTLQVERLMACADLAITKPGGLTAAECLAMGVPMIVHAPVPGQEERNADFLVEHGAALKAPDPVTLDYRLQQLLDNPARLARMRAAALSLGRPGAARHILATILA